MPEATDKPAADGASSDAPCGAIQMVRLTIKLELDEKAIVRTIVLVVLLLV